MSTQTNWHLIHTKPSQELTAQQELERQGYQTYLPKIRLQAQSNRPKRRSLAPLFPRYLFILLTDGVDNWGPIRSTRGVSNLVRFGMQPALIPSTTVQAIKAREDEDGLHSIQGIAFSANDPVRLTNGPFADYEAIFKETRAGDRVLILLNILGNASPVEVDHDNLVLA